jgi:hypothetical protein
MRDKRKLKSGGYCLLELFVVSEILKFKVKSSFEKMELIYPATELHTPEVLDYRLHRFENSQVTKCYKMLPDWLDLRNAIHKFWGLIKNTICDYPGDRQLLEHVFALRCWIW